MKLNRHKWALPFLLLFFIALIISCDKPPELAAGPAPSGTESSDRVKGDAGLDPFAEDHDSYPGNRGEPSLKTEEAALDENAPTPDSPAVGQAQTGESGGLTGESKGNRKKEKEKAADDSQKKTAPASQPERAQESETKTPPKPKAKPAPLSYIWGASYKLTFRSAVQVTNTGSEPAENVWVDLPMLENSSPYQDTKFKSANFELAHKKGRVGSFGIGDLEPGKTVTLKTDYTITIRPLSIKSTNETVEKAREAYEKYAGSGNCLAKAEGFVKRCREMGLTARLVNGYARAQRCSLAPGTLQGCRHSWAEFYVDGLGWLPVDLTFCYFAELPAASHLLECYADQSVQIYSMGGKVSAKWVNSIIP